jgi:hypothetical protein
LLTPEGKIFCVLMRNPRQLTVAARDSSADTIMWARVNSPIQAKWHTDIVSSFWHQLGGSIGALLHASPANLLNIPHI